MRYGIRLLVAILCLVPMTLLNAGDPAQEFSISRNPNGVWSYGFIPGLGGPFALADIAVANSIPEYQQGADSWYSAAQADCSNGRGGTIARIEQEQLHGSQYTFHDTVTQHPGCRGELSVLRWTAPIRGTYQLQGSFQGTQIACGGTSTDVHILWNSASSLFDGDIYGFVNNRELLFNLQQPVAGGDTIDFAVGFGSDGNYYCDATALQLTIDLLASIDIAPADTANIIHIGTRGMVQIAILSNTSFDAPSMVTRSSLTFGRFGDEQSLIYYPVIVPVSIPACRILDVNGDGLKDLVCQFDRQRAGFQLTDTLGVVRGKTKTGVTFKGTDAVQIMQ